MLLKTESGGRMWWHGVTRRGVALSAAAALCGIGVMAAGRGAGAAQAQMYTWPEFHNSPALTGVSSDPAISTANASTLGVKWMAPVGPSLSSPMVEYSSSLGKTLVYVGSRSGFFDALDADTGQVVWSHYLGDPITSSPLVENGSVWVAPQGGDTVFKLDASTGATECTAVIQGKVEATPVVATPPGGVRTVYMAALNSGSANGPVVAYNESDCSEEWQWTDFVQGGAAWDPLSYAVDASGVGLLVFGSADPDSSIYAVNALTGITKWHYASYCPPNEDWDIGAGVDISSPGVNGFADGVTYVEGKDGILYANDLTTGALIWQYNFGHNRPGNPRTVNTDAIGTPALSGTFLVFGDANGIYALNAVTGVKRWFTTGTGVINSSPAIVGPSAQRVVAYGDLGGFFHVLDLATGANIYTYQTGSFITGSPADANGSLLIASNDGFLYDFGLGGGNGANPTTEIQSPHVDAYLTNPDGTLTIEGTATAPDGVASVLLQVEMDGVAGPFYDQSSNRFSSGLNSAMATLTSPGADSTNWSLKVPVPEDSNAFQVLAFAVGENAVADDTAFKGAINAASVAFRVRTSTLAPPVQVSPGRVVPGGMAHVSGSGFAPGEMVTFTAQTDTGGSVTIATVAADSSGSTGVKQAKLPTASAFGWDLITATGSMSGDVGSAWVYISNNSLQVAYGPLHQGDESNDFVIADYQGVTQRLVQGWAFSGGGPFDTTPAISQGRIYFGDQAGDFYGVQQTTGKPLFQITAGAPIESSPAADGSKVFFGTGAGELRAVDAKTGIQVWTASPGGVVSSPTVTGGTVYAGTSGGDLVALNESNGTDIWTATVSGAISSAPAVDSSNSIVVVTTLTGTVAGVSTSTGDVLWSDSVGGAATGPMISNGIIYVGSSAGTVTAFSEATGATVWTSSTGSPVLAAPILAFNGHVAVGTQSGAVIYFHPTTGNVASTETQFGQPITGLSFAASDVFLTSSSGELGFIQGEGYLKMSWKYQASAGYISPMVVLDGDVFVLGQDHVLRAFTVPGRPIT